MLQYNHLIFKKPESISKCFTGWSVKPTRPPPSEAPLRFWIVICGADHGCSDLAVPVTLHGLSQGQERSADCRSVSAGEHNW